MMLKKLFEAICGSRIKKRIFSAGDKNSLFLIFPDGKSEISYYGLLFADLYAAETNKKNILIITSCDIVAKAAELMVSSDKKIMMLSEKELSALTRHLALCIDLLGGSVYDRLICISKIIPNGQAFELLRSGGVFSDEYLVWNRIYHISSTYCADDPDVEPPLYNGGDLALKEFMDHGQKIKKECVNYGY